MTEDELQDIIKRLEGAPIQKDADTGMTSDKGGTTTNTETKEISKETFRKSVVTIVLFFIVCFTISLIRFKDTLTDATNIPLIVAWILFWLFIAWILSGFQRVSPTEVAVKEIFWGTWFQIVETGLTLVVPGVMRIHRFLQEIFTIKIGGPEKDGVTGFLIDHKNGVITCDSPLQVYFPNTQVPDSIKEKVGDKENKGGKENKIVGMTDRIPAWILVTITAKVDPKHVISLLRTGGNLSRVARRIEETTRGIIAQYCNRTEIHTALASLEVMAKEILGEIEELVGDQNPNRIKKRDAEGKWWGEWEKPVSGYKPKNQCWGIDIIRVQVDTPILTDEMQKQVDAAQQAEQKAADKARQARGEEEDLKAKGRGNAYAKRELLNAEADGRKAFMLAEAEGMKEQITACDSGMGRFVRILERDETVAQNAKPMIITEGGGSSVDATIARAAKIWEFAQAKTEKETAESPKKPETTKKGT